MEVRMAYMIRRNPYWKDMYNFEKAMNRFFDMDSEPLPSGFPLDVIENDKEYRVKANMAGFDPKNIEITYDNNTLSVKGEVEEENKNEEEGKYHVRERNYGFFYRSVTMPGLVDADAISAESKNGVLIIHLPKKPEAQPRKIEVKDKNPSSVIDNK